VKEKDDFLTTEELVEWCNQNQVGIQFYKTNRGQNRCKVSWRDFTEDGSSFCIAVEAMIANYGEKIEECTANQASFSR
jgi:hypothetical protein